MKFLKKQKGKIVLLAIIFIFCSTAAFSQVAIDVKTYIGYPVYLNFEDQPDRDFSYSFSGDIGVEYAINEYFGVQSGFTYSTKTITYKAFSASSDHWMNIAVPIYAKVKYPTEFVEFYLLLGPTFEYFFDSNRFNLNVDNNFMVGYSTEIGAGFPIFPDQGSLLVGLHCGSHFTKLYDNHDFDILTIDLVLGYNQKF